MLHDRAIIDGAARITRDGYLVADALVARADNVQEYTAGEIGLTDRAATDRVRLFRPASEVFARDSLASLAHRPITLDHPASDVTAANWRALAVGDVGGEVVRDGEFVRVPIKVMDSAAIASIRTTRGEFSLGYSARFDMTPGVHDGQSYDGTMRDLRFNHLAAVPVARGGPELRIVDERINSGDETVKTIMFDGVPVRLDDAAAIEAIITKSIAARDAAIAQVAAATKLSDEGTGKIAALEGQLADAKAQLDPAAIEKRVADRAALTTAAKSIKTDIVTDGKSDADIRRAAVAAKLGDAATAMNDDAIAGAFAAYASTKPAVVPIGAPVGLADAASLESAALARANDHNGWRTRAANAA